MCFDGKRKQKYHFSNLFLNQVLFIDKNSIFFFFVWFLGKLFMGLAFNAEWFLKFFNYFLIYSVLKYTIHYSVVPVRKQ